MDKHRVAIYVTLLPDLNTVEWYAVRECGDGSSDLTNDGFSEWSKAFLDVVDALLEWRRAAMDGPSPSSTSTSS